MCATKANPISAPATLVMNALRFKQGDANVYSFVLPGDKLTAIADLSRIQRTGRQKLKGFQRPEIQQHIRQITDYLDRGPGLFPNAVILAMSSQVTFSKKRGTKIEDLNVDGVEAGKLVIPIMADGEKAAWIVDGQQRSLALAKSKNGQLLVPVVAFESSTIETHREQFILVNRAKPLSQRLINELLPETDDTLLPRDLAANKIPSELCNLLNTKSSSPLYRRISRTSSRPDRTDVVIDSAIIKMIRERINGTSGALLHLRSDGRKAADLTEMYRLLAAYWAAVARTFPDAWSKPPQESRLTSAVGISIMGVMMDRICARIGYGQASPQAAYEAELTKISKHCAWTSGQWSDIGMPWNALEMTSKSAGRIIQLLGAAYVRAGAR